MASKAQTKVAKTATEALKVLWEATFFRGWKKKADIEGSLSKRGNHFSAPELGMALKRAAHLTRRGKRGNYEYIQKYPHVAEAAGRDKKKMSRD
jgi:hypothetical protein